MWTLKGTAVMLITTLLAMTVVPSVSSQEEAPYAEWTFMIYLDADNNLESAGIEDMEEIETVGSTDEVNIIVQMDRWKGEEGDDDTSNGDWTGAKRFYMEKGSDPGNIESMELDDLGEVNMGDPATLIDFAVWGMESYPASNYALVMWDHGGAFWGVCWDDDVPGSNEADMINMTEMRHAVESIYLHRGAERLEFFGFDACLMAQVAVLYQLKDYVSVSDASGFSEPGDGWPYETILSDLVKTPTMDEAQLGRVVAKRYVESYSDSQGDPDDSPAITMSAFDMTRFDDLVLVLDRFSEEMAYSVRRYAPHIWGARERCSSYDMLNVGPFDFTKYSMYDVYDFTDKLDDRLVSVLPMNSPLITLCEDVRDALEDVTILHENHLLDPQAQVFGLSMYFPNKEDKVDIRQLPTTYDVRYEETRFAREHLWDDFLLSYYNWENVQDSFPVISISWPAYNHTFDSSDPSPSIMGYAYDREEITKVEIRIDGGDWVAIPGSNGQGKIPWLYTLDIMEMEKGPHIVEVRAHDSLGDSQPGHVTEPLKLMVNVEDEIDTVSTASQAFDIALSVLAVLFIVAGIALGVVLFRGRRG